MNIPKLKVQLRGGFSDRNGIQKENIEIQITDFDSRTRTSLVNMTKQIHQLYKGIMSYYEQENVYKKILTNVYVAEVDWAASTDTDKVIEIVCQTIREDNYDAVLTVIDYYANILDANIPSTVKVSARYNEVFEKECVGYRFINSTITSITNTTEILEIEEAASSPYKEVNKHLEKSITLLSDRSSPDYANSIKESISAVERMCSLIIGTPTTLGIALDKLEKSGLKIHSAMKIAFEKLYGYTSDGSGLRHAGQLGGPDSTFEEAKFMLVSCCAFVNYLLGVWAKHS